MVSTVRWLLQISLLLWLSIGAAAAAATQGKPGCQKRCGDVDIPYPFGIGFARCYVDEWFEVTCDKSVHPPKPFLKKINLEVLSVSLDHGTIRVNNPVLIYQDCSGKPSNEMKSWNGGPFSFSETYTRFTAVGCSALAYITTQDDLVNGGCISFCKQGTTAATNSNCNGLECCQTQVPPGLQFFTANLETTIYNGSVPKQETCKYAFMVDHEWFSKLSDPHTVKDKGYVPAVLDWQIYNATCNASTSNFNTSTSFCGTNAHCSVASQRSGVTCACDRGYEGNPYLPEDVKM